MRKKIALVTNALDYVGPPAISALMESGYTVLAQDPAFEKDAERNGFRAKHQTAVPLGIRDPKALIRHANAD